MNAFSFKAFITICFLLSSALSLKLNILGAVYGKLDVTDKVQEAVKNDLLIIQASNEIFGDSWYGNQKSLVIVYQYGDYKPIVAAVSEGKYMTITQESSVLQPWDSQYTGDYNILGAVYGLADATQKVEMLMDQDSAQIKASNDVFGDSWYGTVKTLVIVYQDSQGLPRVSIISEGQDFDTSILFLTSQDKLTIIKAAYGIADVTDIVRGLVAKQGGKSLEVEVSNSVFGDSWYGTQKSLGIVYQYEGGVPQIAAQMEYHRLSISPSKSG